jgi:molybdopterin synthase catalytic subunit
LAGWLTTEAIDVPALIRDATRPGDGGLALFLGVVRDNAAGRPVARMRYDAFGPMAEAEMGKIAEEIAHRWPGARLRMVHRTGWMEVGEASLAIAVAAPHRGECFEACRHALERIKARVPIWKKEVGPAGEVWVEGRSDLGRGTDGEEGP